MKDDIKKAIELLENNGHCVIKITKEMEKRMIDCSTGKCPAEDCIGCVCSVCILHN